MQQHSPSQPGKSLPPAPRAAPSQDSCPAPHLGSCPPSRYPPVLFTPLPGSAPLPTAAGGSGLSCLQRGWRGHQAAKVPLEIQHVRKRGFEQPECCLDNFKHPCSRPARPSCLYTCSPPCTHPRPRRTRLSHPEPPRAEPLSLGQPCQEAPSLAISWWQ